jgi:hypothetical protein
MTEKSGNLRNTRPNNPNGGRRPERGSSNGNKAGQNQPDDQPEGGQSVEGQSSGDQPSGEEGKAPAKRGRKNRSYDVSPEDFVRAWQSSSTTQEVSEKLGMPIPIAVARASAYRKGGVDLKKLSKKASRVLDVEGLNRLIEEMEKTKGDERGSEKGEGE